jgi:phospholipid N-methyltransferase
LIASGTSRRAYHFECGDNGQEISIEIQDRAFIEDALGSRTWGSAPLLVSYLLREYFSSALNQERKECLRILELGAGTGLVGLAIAQYIQDFSDWQAEVCLTDYHQDVLANLKGNMQLNRLIKQHDRVQVIVSHLDWNDTQSEEVQGPFDCIVAAGECSLVYEDH